jgi:hypothetical protein
MSVPRWWTTHSRSGMTKNYPRSITEEGLRFILTLRPSHHAWCHGDGHNARIRFFSSREAGYWTVHQSLSKHRPCAMADSWREINKDQSLRPVSMGVSWRISLALIIMPHHQCCLCGKVFMRREMREFHYMWDECHHQETLLWHCYLVASIGTHAMKLCTEIGLIGTYGAKPQIVYHNCNWKASSHHFLGNQKHLSGLSTAGSKFVSIVRRARMVSIGDNGI